MPVDRAKKIEIAPGVYCYDRREWKYELCENYRTVTRILPPVDYHTKFISLNTAGVLSIKKGYAWDGPSGPTHDDIQGWLASLIHDALCQLMFEGLLDAKFKKRVDKELVRVAKESGMPYFRRRAWYRAVRWFAPRYKGAKK